MPGVSRMIESAGTVHQIERWPDLVKVFVILDEKRGGGIVTLACGSDLDVMVGDRVVVAEPDDPTVRPWVTAVLPYRGATVETFTIDDLDDLQAALIVRHRTFLAMSGEEHQTDEYRQSCRDIAARAISLDLRLGKLRHHATVKIGV